MSPSFSGQAAKLLSPIPQQNEFDYYTKIQQSDLVPTISSLLGWTHPRNNIGVLLQSFLGLWKGSSSALLRESLQKTLETVCPLSEMELSNLQNWQDSRSPRSLRQTLSPTVLRMIILAVSGVAVKRRGMRNQNRARRSMRVSR